MVLTRAQRAQTKVTPPESPLKSSVLKAPARRGRAKKADAEEEKGVKTTKARKTTKAASVPKATETTEGVGLKSSVSKTASARTATTKASAARAAATKAAPAKATSTRVAATRTAAQNSTDNKEKTSRKAVANGRTVKAIKQTKQAKPHAERKSEPNVGPGIPDETPKELSTKQQSDVVDEKEGMEEQSAQAPAEPLAEARPSVGPEAPAALSPTKLPRPAPSPTKPVSPLKASFPSSGQGLGLVRKPVVSGALPASTAEPVFLVQSPAKLLVNTGSPVHLNTSVKDFATILGPPKRPSSSGGDNCSTENTSETPKRPHTDDNTIHVSAKRLRTSMSMPSLGSPQRLQSSTSDTPPSPTKSSMRSPEKRPGISPKKVSWHQTPPRPAPAQERTPPPTEPGILEGCVFFLDINSLTGANQNSLFLDLVEELGGICVQEWSHNNMGITHVLFMNGEMRTLEKVLASNGEVFCVSLGWLLDCQRENLRIPENQPRYLIDLTHVPGHTPKPNRGALNTPMTSKTSAPVSHTPALPPPKWGLPTTPAVAREPLGALPSSLLITTPSLLALKATPAPPPSVGMGTIDEHDKENVSPVSEATPLVQKTCPPKQLNKSIMSMNTGISATPLRNRFLVSKRRRSFDGIQKPSGPGLQSPPRKALGLGSPKRQASPMKKSQFRA